MSDVQFSWDKTRGDKTRGDKTRGDKTRGDRTRGKRVRAGGRVEAGRDVINITRFEVAQGERVFISGASGSGKSTLLSLLGGILVPRAGDVEVLGRNLVRLTGGARDRFRADHLGYVFQMFNLVPYLSVLDNVTLPCRFSARRRVRAGAASCASPEPSPELAPEPSPDSLSESLSDPSPTLSKLRADESPVHSAARRLLAALELGELGDSPCPVTTLSIGQQQRVAAARALIGSPEVVIADEPTSALDEGTRQRFLELLFRECDRQGTALVFVSHDQRLGGLFDRQVRLDEINHASCHV